MIPPKQRSQLASSAQKVSSLALGGVAFGGKALWVLVTSALLVGIPFGLAFLDEQAVMDQEREMRAHQSANEVRALLLSPLLVGL